MTVGSYCCLCSPSTLTYCPMPQQHPIIHFLFSVQECSRSMPFQLRSPLPVTTHACLSCQSPLKSGTYSLVSHSCAFLPLYGRAPCHHFYFYFYFRQWLLSEHLSRNHQKTLQCTKEKRGQSFFPGTTEAQIPPVNSLCGGEVALGSCRALHSLAVSMAVS